MINHADLILENANVITCEPGNPTAEAVAVKGKCILQVGANSEMVRVKGPHTRIIDCQNKVLIPGFNDAHCHIFALVRKLFSLNLSPQAVRSIEDIKEAIRRKVRLTPEGNWVSGTDYNEFYLMEKRHPTRWDLDEVAPRHPVILTHRSLHAVVLNSLALKMVGITNETEEPPGGIIDRDLNSGEPNGIIFEMLDYIRPRIAEPISETETDWGISEVNRIYLANGITSIGEATVTNNFEQWQTFQKLKEAGKLKSRIYMMLGMEALSEFKSAGLITGSGDNELKVGSLKIVLSETTGRLYPSQEELNQTVLEASRAGFQVAIHAVERSTVEAAVSALEYSQKQFPQASHRHRIEHCSECPPEIWHRMSRLKAVVVSQPPFVYYSGQRYLAQVSSEARQWLYPFKSMMDSGLTIAASSDSPVVPDNPLIGIYAAITRRAESGQEVLSGEAVSPRRALEMYTHNAAYSTFEENIKGTLSSGKMADMVMLSENPIQSHPKMIRDIKVEKTIIGGKVEYET